MNEQKKFLIIRFGAIGDVVVTTGLVRALKKTGAQIDYLTTKAPSLLLENDPDIEKIWLLESKSYFNILNLADKFRQEKYDCIFNLQPSVRTKILCTLSFPKKTVTYKKDYKFHAVENFFDTGKKYCPDLELDKNLKLFLPEELKEKMNTRLENKKRICFNIGANSSRQGRKWEVKNWAQLAQMIKEKYDVQIVAIGAQEDVEKVNELTSLYSGITSFAGKLSLTESACLISCCDLIISGDTGPLHIATALGPVCIGLYGCPAPSRSGPYGEKHSVIVSTLPCAPCDGRKCKLYKSEDDNMPCMQEIKPKKVMNLVDTVLNQIIYN
ncbi:MAG: glycosyltransferase family 9 protein [Candidatus Gastranaerophilales bacterium]|nr:glycosyltransferase family 9 protein [Candidatus Gastranaerophilales bacterium]